MTEVYRSFLVRFKYFAHVGTEHQCCNITPLITFVIKPNRTSLLNDSRRGHRNRLQKQRNVCFGSANVNITRESRAHSYCSTKRRLLEASRAFRATNRSRDAISYQLPNGGRCDHRSRLQKGQRHRQRDAWFRSCRRDSPSSITKLSKEHYETQRTITTYWKKIVAKMHQRRYYEQWIERAWTVEQFWFDENWYALTWWIQNQDFLQSTARKQARTDVQRSTTQWSSLRAKEAC